MIRIHRREQLVGLAKMLGMRRDWHEPDEQDVTAEVRGSSFDNAGHWPEDPDRGGDYCEMYVVLKVEDEEVAAVNLATLLAWASEEKY